MPDLSWTLPVARWSFWSPAVAETAEVAFIDPMMRRRLSSLSRMALKVAHDCVQNVPQARVVFASRHGELRRTTDILHGIEADKPVLPNAFSLSVLNAMSGLFGIAREDRSPANAISAGPETLGYALLEAYAQYTEEPTVPVLLVYADEPADGAYGQVDHEVQQGALALLLDAGQVAQGHLACTVCEIEHETEHEIEHEAGKAGVTHFATQSAALHHCLDTQSAAAWQHAGAIWQWGWHVSAV
ncbi:beta-ketoacyl synthase chain length factor [Paraburkholderia sp. SUR17]|uniref:beta-ketoacyl synthase chain length factor n=1 Tax=Paraburkholderia sp. SUR17 TaxID=3034358 RepID=UPI002407B273|nr:beta-ketoacyl synthase chain length factor [Paraburkholderia sp. SUR17]WEY40126.1 beta-ketoacyl synthase chain length factor [Paraburkholderia sp. SUR17]